MSLQPGFRSTIFGPLIAIGEIVGGFTFTLIVTAWLLHRPPLADMISVEAFNDLGNLLFTFLFIWGYLNFFQIMLIWIANSALRHQLVSAPRARRLALGRLGLFIFHFAIPFFLLLDAPAQAQSTRCSPCWRGSSCSCTWSISITRFCRLFRTRPSPTTGWLSSCRSVPAECGWPASCGSYSEPPCCRNMIATRRRLSISIAWTRCSKPVRGRLVMPDEINHPDGRLEHPSVRREPTDASFR